MKISVREMTPNDSERIVDYFYNATEDYIKGMGAYKSKLPNKSEWIQKLDLEHQKPYDLKENYYIIWQIDKQEIGHSNINRIQFGNHANMHLHLWTSMNRKQGLGFKLLEQTIPFYFEHFKLKKLICEPYSENPAPNKILTKVGFEFIKAYETIPGFINFNQIVNRYELTKDNFNKNLLK